MAPQQGDEDERDGRLGDAEQPLLAAETPPSQGPSTLFTVCPFILGTYSSMRWIDQRALNPNDIPRMCPFYNTQMNCSKSPSVRQWQTHVAIDLTEPCWRDDCSTIVL